MSAHRARVLTVGLVVGAERIERGGGRRGDDAGGLIAADDGNEEADGTRLPRNPLVGCVTDGDDLQPRDGHATFARRLRDGCGTVTRRLRDGYVTAAGRSRDGCGTVT